MLDEKTLKWLSIRETTRLNYGKYYCVHCKMFSPNRLCRSALCPIDVAHVVHRDVAEFEARVAAKLAGTSGPEPCEHGNVKHCPWPRSVLEGKRTCSFCQMKYARLAVEKEMDEKL